MKKQTKNSKIIITITAIILIALAILFVGLRINEMIQSDNNTGGKMNAVGKEESQEPVEIGISFAGDIMAHMPQIDGAKSGDGYDFGESFKYLKEYLDQSDLALCNLETTFAGKPYTGYPMFSAPDELAENIKEAGFDVAVTTNNHAFDKGTDGIKRTIEVANEAGLETVGTRSDSTEKDYLITTVNGIKIGIVATTEETPMSGSERTLNGITMNSENHQLINSYSKENLEEDLQIIKESIDNAKNEGAQIIIAYFHWGEEYDREPNSQEEEIAQKVADFGADMIFASHPHVLQKKDTITTDDNGTEKTVPIFYSMGNFLSNQRVDTVDNRYSEQGMIAQAKVTYDPEQDQITEVKTGYIPTWVDKYYGGTGYKFVIIPLIGSYQNNDTLIESGHVSAAEGAYADIKDILGEPENILND